MVSHIRRPTRRAAAPRPARRRPPAAAAAAASPAVGVQNLPHHIISDILRRTSPRNAARAHAVSRQWRNISAGHANDNVSRAVADSFGVTGVMLFVESHLDENFEATTERELERDLIYELSGHPYIAAFHLAEPRMNVRAVKKKASFKVCVSYSIRDKGRYSVRITHVHTYKKVQRDLYKHSDSTPYIVFDFGTVRVVVRYKLGVRYAHGRPLTVYKNVVLGVARLPRGPKRGFETSAAVYVGIVRHIIRKAFEVDDPVVRGLV